MVSTVAGNGIDCSKWHRPFTKGKTALSTYLREPRIPRTFWLKIKCCIIWSRHWRRARLYNKTSPERVHSVAFDNVPFLLSYTKLASPERQFDWSGKEELNNRIQICPIYSNKISTVPEKLKCSQNVLNYFEQYKPVSKTKCLRYRLRRFSDEGSLKCDCISCRSYWLPAIFNTGHLSDNSDTIDKVRGQSFIRVKVVWSHVKVRRTKAYTTNAKKSQL